MDSVQNSSRERETQIIAKNIYTKGLGYVLAGAAIAFVSYFIGVTNFLLFHTGAEFFICIVTGSIFVVAWNTRDKIDNGYYLFLGIASFFISLIHGLHSVSYKGLEILGEGSNVATQLWLIARYMQAFSFILAPLFIGRPPRPWTIVVTFAVFTTALLSALFYWDVFPDAYIEGAGLTLFKTTSEYIISLLFCIGIFMLWRVRQKFDQKIYRLTAASIVSGIAGELAFTHYVSVYGFYNIIGHLLVILSFYLLYRALVETAFVRPYHVLFTNLRQSEERYRGLVQMSPSAIFVNRGGRIAFVNPAAEAIFGAKSPEELLGKDPYTLFHPEYHAMMSERVKALLEGEKVPLVEGRIMRLDGTVRYAEIAATPFDDEGGRAIQVVVRDINDRKVAEMALRRNEQRLHGLVEELTRSNQDLEQFAYVISHDLQAPLRQISGFISLLEKKYGDMFDKGAREYMDFINDAVSHMSNLIRDLLAYSRVRKEQHVLVEVDLNSAVKTALRNLQTRFQQANVQVEVGSLPKVQGFEPLLVQVFQNLFENALKFNDKKTPLVQVASEKQEGNWLIWVRDNGIGFTPQQAGRIFMVFQRLHTQEKYPGTGIGLAICKRVIELHGGKIWAESQPGQGATFFMTIPAVQEG